MIKDTNGKVVFEMNNVEVPKSWSQIATEILAQKYFRKTDVLLKNGKKGGENSISQVVHRMVNYWKQWGEKYGYFASKKDVQIFYDEVVYTIFAQNAALNSPQWFNTGLYSSYGIRFAVRPGNALTRDCSLTQLSTNGILVPKAVK